MTASFCSLLLALAALPALAQPTINGAVLKAGTVPASALQSGVLGSAAGHAAGDFDAAGAAAAAQAAAQASSLQKASNLSDVASAATARANLSAALAGSCSSNQWVTGTTSGSAPTCARPAASQLSNDSAAPGSTVQAALSALAPSGSNQLITWAQTQSFAVSTVTRDGNGAVSSASVVWPDGSTGTFTTDTASAACPGAVDAYHVTYVPASGGSHTVTQSAVTRSATTCLVSSQPTLTVN